MMQITQEQVTVFSADLSELKEKFINEGPSSVGPDLDQGKPQMLYYFDFLAIRGRSYWVCLTLYLTCCSISFFHVVPCNFLSSLPFPQNQSINQPSIKRLCIANTDSIV